MTNKNHPVDNIFSKGLTDFTVIPSEDAKKKLFSVPKAIKPIKPWYVVYKYILFIAPAVILISAFTYFSFFDNKTNSPDLNTENLISNTSILKNKSVAENNKNSAPGISNYKKINSSDQNISSNTQTSETKPTKPELNSNEFKNINQSKNKSETIDNITNNDFFSDANVKENNNNIKTEQNSTFSNNKLDIKTESTTINNTHNNTSEKNIGTNQHKPKNLNAENKSNKTVEENTIQLSESHNSINIVKSSDYLTSYRIPIEPITPLKPELCIYLPDIYFETKKESEYVLKGFWFVEFKIGSFGSNYKVNAKENEWQKAADAKQKLLQFSPGNDFQLNAVYLRNNLIFKAGLSYVNYGEKLSGNVLLTNPQNQTNINFNNNAPYDIIIGSNYYNIDTIGGYYHYVYTQTDHIYISDSSWEWDTQNTPADVYDTTQVTIFDTLPENIFYNNIRFFEIPISIGFVKPYGKFSVGISASASPGLFLAVKGSTMSIDSYPAIEPYQKSNLQKFIFSAGLNLEIGYQINEKLMLSFEPFYKKSLVKLYNESNKINQSYDSYGFRIGLRKLL